MASPQNLVSRAQKAARTLADLQRELQLLIEEYAASGGDGAAHAHFVQVVDGAESPRTDLHFTESDFHAAVAVLSGLGDAINPAHRAVLLKIAADK
jgi:hypothetical protein